MVGPHSGFPPTAIISNTLVIYTHSRDPRKGGYADVCGQGTEVQEDLSISCHITNDARAGLGLGAPDSLIQCCPPCHIHVISELFFLMHKGTRPSSWPQAPPSEVGHCLDCWRVHLCRSYPNLWAGMDTVKESSEGPLKTGRQTLVLEPCT